MEQPTIEIRKTPHTQILGETENMKDKEERAERNNTPHKGKRIILTCQ